MAPKFQFLGVWHQILRFTGRSFTPQKPHRCAEWRILRRHWSR